MRADSVRPSHARQRRINGRRFTWMVISLLLITGWMIPAGASAAPRSAAMCRNVTSMVQGYALPEGDVWNAYATVIDGDLGGPGSSLTATLVIDKVTPGGTTWFTGSHTFTNDTFGTMTSSDVIVVAPNGRFNSTYVLVNGAWGVIHSHGTIDFATGFLEARYHGRVCQE